MVPNLLLWNIYQEGDRCMARFELYELGHLRGIYLNKEITLSSKMTFEFPIKKKKKRKKAHPHLKRIEKYADREVRAHDGLNAFPMATQEVCH